jgi:hypothetical protein
MSRFFEFVGVGEHALDRKKVSKAPQLFRIPETQDDYVVGVELVRRFKQLDLTNVFLTELRVV